MSRQQMVELICLGIILADPKRLADVESNCWEGAIRMLVDELKILTEGKKADTANVKRLVDETLHVWWSDGKLGDALIERLKEFGEHRKAQLCGGDFAWKSTQERSLRELARKRERDQRS